MTAVQALRLSPGQTLRALEAIDLPRLAAERLLAGAHALTPVLLEPGPGWPRPRPEVAEIAVRDPGTGAVALLPAATLAMIGAAGLTLAACRVLAAPGVLTAAVFGNGSGLELPVSVLARFLPGLSHVTVPRALVPVQGGHDVLAELDRAGIGLAALPDPRRAARGANLVIFTAAAAEVPDIGSPAPGTLLVNATGRDLPAPVQARVDRVYVDDPGLLARSRPRGWNEAAPLLRNREGWYRHHEAGHPGTSAAVALRDVLSGSAPGRTGDEEVLLAELIGATEPDAVLAGRLWQAAVARGLGDRVEQEGEE